MGGCDAELQFLLRRCWLWGGLLVEDLGGYFDGPRQSDKVGLVAVRALTKSLFIRRSNVLTR